MKLTGATMIFALAAVLVAGCGTMRKVSKATTGLVTGDREAPHESAWNSERTWKKISDNPPTYAPYNYSGAVDSGGEWLTDERDGKRLFIPVGGVDGIPASVLRAEAWKATRK